MRIILVRHGQPHIALSPRASHAGFGDYIDAYEESGLAPSDLPPAELSELVREIDHVFTSDRPRSRQSAAVLAPEAMLTADPLFAEAPLATPPIPLLRMAVPKWAVMSRILWHAGFSPRIENARASGRRADQAADTLVARAKQAGTAVLVAHGYFNWMIGRRLKKRGFVRTGSHQARYWNTVIYEDAMIEEKIEIPTINTETLLLRPDRVGEFPGVVFLTDIWGIRPANIGMAKRLSEKGFAVLMPNVFHRYSRITSHGWKPDGEAEVQKALHALFGTLTAEQMVSDGKAYVDFLLAQAGVKPGKIGVVGYCFTGQMALRIAAAEPERVAAAASFHGGFLVTDKPDSPHKQIPQVKARLYFGHAVEDASATPQQVATLEDALRDWHGAFQSEVYEGARHGWTVPGQAVYNELQAERAFAKLVELFDATLK